MLKLSNLLNEMIKLIEWVKLEMIASTSSNLEIGARAMSCVIWKMLLYLTIEYFIECSRKRFALEK